MQFKSMLCFIIVMLLFSLMCRSEVRNSISVQPATTTLSTFDMVPVNIDLDFPFQNPYDPVDIRVDAIFQTPAADSLILPGFYQSGESPQSQWEVRFTPRQAGHYTGRIVAATPGDTLISDSFMLQVTTSEKNGFLQRNPESDYAFRFDSGARFRGVGMNLGWEFEPKWGGKKQYTYEIYLDALAKNHANFIRTWMCPWNLPLEWTRVVRYTPVLDEFEDWKKMATHSAGLVLESGKAVYAEDDSHRISIASAQPETIVYHLPDLKKFKLKVYHQQQLPAQAIRFYASMDNESYTEVDIERSQAWQTHANWQRVFLMSVNELPAGTHYLKIKISPDLVSTPKLAGILLHQAPPIEVLATPGLGKYDQTTAQRLDEILQLAEEKGIYLMLTLDYHGIFNPQPDVWGANDEWRRNPYNVANGGPCEQPKDFFINTEARRLYKNRLRYLVARWGYSPHLAVWEFWNEIDNAMVSQHIPPETITAWHREMAAYLKQIDPYHHLVSTSVSYRAIPQLWDNDHLDFTQRHLYGPTAQMKPKILEYRAAYPKPHVVGEFSVGWKGPGKDYPAAQYETELHRGLWRGMFSPTPILPMTWWWDWHYEQQHYFHFKTAADFVKPMLQNPGIQLEDWPVTCEASKIEILGLKSGTDRFIWLVNQRIDDLSALTVMLPEEVNRTYSIKYYDTWTGAYSEMLIVSSVKGQLLLPRINLPAGRDLAVWLEER